MSRSDKNEAPLAPQVRASFLFDALAIIRQHPAAQRILGYIPAALIADVERRTRLDWVDMRDNIVLYESVRKALTIAEADALWHDTMLRSLGEGLLGALGDSHREMGPAPLLRAGPRGWKQGTRNCGLQMFEAVDDHHARILWRDMPQVVIGSTAYIDAIEAKYRAHLTHSGTTGRVRSLARDAARGNVCFDIEWAPIPARR